MNKKQKREHYHKSEQVVELSPTDSPFQKLFRDKIKNGELPFWFNPEDLKIFDDE